MNLWSWYSHSWYPFDRWEIGFDLRRWAIGGYRRQSETALFLGPILICRDSGLSPK